MHAEEASLQLGDRFDEELTVAIREIEGHLIVDADALQQFGFFHLEHHRHGLHVVRDVFVGDGDVVFAFADRADFAACRVRLSRRTARSGLRSSSLFLRLGASERGNNGQNKGDCNEKRRTASS